jgi:predicted lipoprotein with Yx(FWY)xxD motif
VTAWTAVVVSPAGAAAKPGAPGRPAAVAGDKSARVSWAAPSNGGSPITIYLVTPYLGTHAQATRAFHSNKTAEVVTGLTNGKTYTFRVAAHNAVGTGAMSVASKAVTIGLPGVPTNLTVAPGNGQATVAWSTPANGGSAITSYVITPYKGSTAQSTHTFASTADSEIVTGLTNDQSYAFRVAARNAVGLGAQSTLSVPVKPTSAATLTVANKSGHPNVIVDAYGHALYLFTPDGSSTTTKADSSLIGLWPEVAWSGTPTVGGGLDASKVAVYVQHDGTRQLSYNHHLLYTFLYDFGPNDATGDGVSSFYLLGPDGNAT